MGKNLQIYTVWTSPETLEAYQQTLTSLSGVTGDKIQQIVDWEAEGKPADSAPDTIDLDQILPATAHERGPIDDHISGIRTSVEAIKSAALLLKNGLI